MNEAQAFEIVRKALKPRRFEHTERVVSEASKLAERFGGNLEKIRLAAILHDYAKYRSYDEMRSTVLNNRHLPNRLLEYGNELLHSFVGAVYVQEELKVDDDIILSAIRYHTTGRAGMTLEEKIVFLADYIEPGRTFPEAGQVRETAEADLDKGCLEALRNTIVFLSKKSLPVYPDTFEAYNEFAINLRAYGG
ncbi:bis(5'-nucleosyl)-tetraphosphatase (symmetrical) YqeK [Salipaludibacillus aurantiacus]|uniref:bis(5'-nucleosyl)-tetraphosphatase (symmetrical) n=1 Tax=Salipaludibacillus aurantiacus TaxID=1601833 RepID=A0A1H9RH24_9BACI|nr:bis(5'-nucleosyl)-tetraphosphatase (symmetrical) YqeK [Salipaludibacillus aurantiacus]SER71279.1 putative HD superfamily hydrolase of NAD metabolism [Salipaludibacillus aurantiacus]